MFKKLFRINLYPMFDAEGGGAGGEGANPEGQGNNSSGEGNNQKNQGEGNNKTFTQEDLNRIGATEKRQGIASVLKNLGFEDEEKAKAFVNKYRQQEEDKKDDLTKAQENLQTEKKAKEEAEKRADLADKKFKVATMGVPSANIDDVVILATSKAVDGKTFDDALKELKTSYPTLFSAESQNRGTGTGGTHPSSRKHGDNSGLAKRLAEQRKNTSGTKSKYFSS